MKLHHAVSDGVGLLHMTESLVERSREPRPRKHAAPAPEVEKESPRAAARLRAALAERRRIDSDRNRRAARAALSGLRAFAANPAEVLRDARDVVGSLGRLLEPVSEPMSPIMRERGTSLRLRSFAIPLEELKRAGKALQGTVNDAFVSGIAAGLRQYHAHHGAPVDELRMTMPINLREGEKGKKAGNQFAPARFLVPVGIEDPAERTRVIQERVVEQRGEPALPLFDDVNSVLSLLPKAATRALASGMLKAIDFTTSNVPGPRFPVYASGAKIEHMFPFGPPAGAAVNITLFSYDGVCHVGVNADAAAVADPDLLVECLKKGVDEVLAVR
jgi:WS/DGAT/MGAT family acyltransferase